MSRRLIQNLFYFSFSFLLLARGAFAQEGSYARTSLFRRHYGGVHPVPTPLAAFKQSLEDLTLQNKMASTDSRPELIYNFIPLGRSLQAASTDFAHPRVLFGFAPSGNSAGSRQDYQDLVDQIFVSFSELQNKLEVISWNKFEGRFNFEEVRNYIPGPGQSQIYVTEKALLSNQVTLRDVCLTCHQSGGPIYSDKPWSESSSSFDSRGNEKSAIVERIEEALNSSYYLGLKIDPRDSQGHRPVTGGKIHAVVKSAHTSLLNARRMARQGCGKDFQCRRSFLKSVIQLAKNGYYDDSENNFFIMTPFRDELAPLISMESMPHHHFSYPSHTLVDFDPLSGPGPIAKEVNPATPREFIEGLFEQPGRDLNEVLATQMLVRGFEGLGFAYADLPTFQSCKTLELNQIFESEEFKNTVLNWQLNDSDMDPLDLTPVYESVLHILRSSCSKPNLQGFAP